MQVAFIDMGTIKLKVSDLAGRSKLQISDIVNSTGMPYNTVKRHWHEIGGGISWDTLAKYCELFNCQPGDLLEYIPDNNGSR